MDIFEKLTAAVNFYQRMYAYEEAIDKTRRAIVSMEKNRNLVIRKAGKKAWPGVVAITVSSYVLSIILPYCCLFFMLLILISAGMSVEAELAEALIPVFFAAFFMGMQLAGLLVSLFYKFKLCNPVTKKRRAEAESTWYNNNNEQYVQLKETLNRLIGEKQNYFNENVHVLDFFPDGYSDATAIVYMFKCVRDKRADTLKEAINLYEEQKHRWTIEQQNENIRSEIEIMRDAQERANAETQEQLRKIGRDVEMANVYSILQ